MAKNDSGLVEERGTHNSRDGARARAAEVGLEEYAVHGAVGSTMGIEEQGHGAGVH